MCCLRSRQCNYPRKEAAAFKPSQRHALPCLRTLGAPVKLIADGDIAGIIHSANTEDSSIDLYLGSGGAPEGVLAAAAMRCLGGQMQGRLVLDSEDKRVRAEKLGITDFKKKYGVQDLAGGDVLFTATGVTDGSLVPGVKIRARDVTTTTVVMRSWSGTMRWVTARHLRLESISIQGS